MSIFDHLVKIKLEHKKLLLDSASLELIIYYVSINRLGFISYWKRNSNRTEKINVTLVRDMLFKQVRAVTALSAVSLEEILEGIELILRVTMLEIYLRVFLKAILVI